MKKINYEKFGLGLIFVFVLFVLYSLFNYLIVNLKNWGQDSKEFEYISKINRDFVANKTVIVPVDNFFNRELNITDTKMTLKYTLNDSNDCEDFVKSIYGSYNVWTNIHIKTPVYEKNIPEDQLKLSYELICQQELTITFTIDKENESFIKRQKEQKEYEENRKKEQLIYDNNTKELEHILLNLRNYYQKDSYLNSPYSFLKNEIDHNSDDKILTLTYFDTNYNFCKRSMNIFRYNKVDEFKNQTIIYFDIKTTNLIIDDIDLNKLDESTIPYICKENNKIRYIFDKKEYIKLNNK